MTRIERLGLAAMIVVGSVVVIAWALELRDGDRGRAGSIAAPAIAARPSVPTHHRSDEQPERTTIARAPDPEPAPHAAAERRATDKAGWHAAREQIEQALQSRASTSRANRSSGEDEPPLPTLDRQYIRETVRHDMLPLVQECYNDLLARAPSASGRMVLRFAIMGDENVGGLVDDVDLDEQSEIQDDQFRECLTESTMSTIFPPPPEGGTVEVTYPLVFSVDPD